jgi:hypothetical protein
MNHHDITVYRKGKVGDEEIYDKGKRNTQSTLYGPKMKSSSPAGLHIGKE